MAFLRHARWGELMALREPAAPRIERGRAEPGCCVWEAGAATAWQPDSWVPAKGDRLAWESR